MTLQQIELPRLSVKESLVYTTLSFNDDTPITEIYATLYPGKPAPELRGQQMAVGKFISRLNEKLTACSVRPGQARSTYRLYFS